jgi:V/A-type H+-transporting ATPase subunit C
MPDLVHALFPKTELSRPSEFQRLLVDELVRELSGFTIHLFGPGAHLFNWLLLRFQMENLKVLLRAVLTEKPLIDPEEYLIGLPKGLAIDTRGLATARSLQDFVRLIPRGPIRAYLEKVIALYDDHPRPFFPEAALDQFYLKGLMARVEALAWEDRAIIMPMMRQEADIFLLMLVVRGKFHYGLTPDILLPLHIPAARISRTLFTQMTADSDLNTAVMRAAGKVLDEMPPECAADGGSVAETIESAIVERLAWRRFLRLSNLAFRRSHIGLGTVMGYTGLRRMEVANLTTISEGIGGGLSPEAIRVRLISPAGTEAAHV